MLFPWLFMKNHESSWIFMEVHDVKTQHFFWWISMKIHGQISEHFRGHWWNLMDSDGFCLLFTLILGSIWEGSYPWEISLLMDIHESSWTNFRTFSWTLMELDGLWWILFTFYADFRFHLRRVVSMRNIPLLAIQ